MRLPSLLPAAASERAHQPWPPDCCRSCSGPGPGLAAAASPAGHLPASARGPGSPGRGQRWRAQGSPSLQAGPACPRFHQTIDWRKCCRFGTQSSCQQCHKVTAKNSCMAACMQLSVPCPVHISLPVPGTELQRVCGTAGRPVAKPHCALAAVMKFAQLVVGPAGSGKVRSTSGLPGVLSSCRRRSPPLTPPPLTACCCLRPRQSTYCETIKSHCDAISRPVHVVNLGECPARAGRCKGARCLPLTVYAAPAPALPCSLFPRPPQTQRQRSSSTPCP